MGLGWRDNSVGKGTCCQPNGLSSIPRTRIVTAENSCNMSSDLRSCIVVGTWGHVRVCAHKINRCKKGWGLSYLSLTWTSLCCWSYPPPWLMVKPRIVQVCVFDLHKFPMKTVDGVSVTTTTVWHNQFKARKKSILSLGCGDCSPWLMVLLFLGLWWGTAPGRECGEEPHGRKAQKGKRKRSGSLRLLQSHASITRRPPMRPRLPELPTSPQSTN